MPKSETIQDVPPIHDADLRLLRIFKSVVESEGFSAAEVELGVGRSTISKHISGLEARLNVRLCERGRSGFSITPHGQTVYSATIELLDALDNFRAKVSTAKGRLSGSAHLWTLDNSHNETGNPLVKAIAQFKERPGNVQLMLNAADPKSVEDAVASGLAHVGITIANGEIPGLVYKSIGRETTSLYCSTSHPLQERLTSPSCSESDLAACDFVLRGYLRNEQNLRGRVWRSTAMAGHVEATLQLVLTGNYLGVIPDHMADRWVTSGHICKVQFPGAQGSTEIFLVYRTKSTSNPTIKALLEDILANYQS